MVLYGKVSDSGHVYIVIQYSIQYIILWAAAYTNIQMQLSSGLTKNTFISTDMQDNYLNVCFLEGTVFLRLVVDCGLVTRSRESSYRPSEFLM